MSSAGGSGKAFGSIRHGPNPLIYMRFHGVFPGEQHEIWPKQHNGKVSNVTWVRCQNLPMQNAGLQLSATRVSGFLDAHNPLYLKASEYKCRCRGGDIREFMGNDMHNVCYALHLCSLLRTRTSTNTKPRSNSPKVTVRK